MSLADRIVVMYKGRIEQIGTPMEVYQDSATRFVAEFIGTPPTNFFVTKIEKTADGLMAVNDDIHYLVPDSLKDALLPYAGKEVDLGVRPEYIDLSFSMDCLLYTSTLTSKRFASVDNRRLFCHQLSVSCEKGGILELSTGINGQITNSGVSHFCLLYTSGLF